MSKIQSIRGMNDCLPSQTPAWHYVESVIARVMKAYSYNEIRFPILEATELFKRSIGEVTDIVEKEMYTFADRNGDSVTLRPEGTAGCVRACEQSGLLYNQTQRLWYMGPMFRYEKPQLGRLRQFHQLGVEAFGLQGPDIDAELLLLSARLWRELGVDQHVTLHINSLGSAESRARYKRDLVEFLQSCKNELDADSQRRLETNPLRILDSKVEQTQALLNQAPDFLNYLDDAAKAHFDGLLSLLEAAGIKYKVNSRLVRGLDYYGLTVFEWVTDALGAQGTVCGGGRYDALVAQLGGKATPAVGFGMGLERLVLLVETCGAFPSTINEHVDAYLVYEEAVLPQSMQLAESLRNKIPDLRLQLHCGGGSIKSQMKKADKSGANYALILGEQETQANVVAVKFLREERPQVSVGETELIQLLNKTK